jgi:F-type H+-transporting ATPase subunit delta
MKSSVATSEVAQPYAQALMSIAQSKNLTDEFGNDTRSLLEL